MNSNTNEKKQGTNSDRSIKTSAVGVISKKTIYLKQNVYKVVVKRNISIIVMLLYKTEVCYQLKYCVS